jgi:hypothetical protein
MIILEERGGDHLEVVVLKMIVLQKMTHQVIKCKFNGITVKAAPGMTHEEIISNFYKRRAEKEKRYLASPQYAIRQEEYRKIEALRKADLEEVLQIAPFEMSVKDQEAYEDILRVQTSPYSKAVIQVADQWARIMEYRISLGETLEECADKSMDIADDQGLSGYMYGIVVAFLCEVWIYGEQLRQWHNDLYGVNSDSGVVNPALITIK